MKIALHDSEQNKYPNIALMKISSHHKAMGDSVEWFKPLFAKSYDKVYSSKIFTWTPEDPALPPTTVKGGIGYGLKATLPDEIEHRCPDYTLYDCKTSYGFLTRGCPRKCPWCFVPEKEGGIKAHADIEEFARHKEVVLMDNNVLAHKHGIAQIEKVVKLGLKVDFNQGLDARLIDESMARLLAKIRWLEPLRLACDTSSQIPSIERAVRLLRYNNCTPSRYFVYTLVQDDVEDALERVKFLKTVWCDPFAQPYRDHNGTMPGAEAKQFARWVNHKALFKTITWEEYRKGVSHLITDNT